MFLKIYTLVFAHIRSSPALANFLPPRAASGACTDPRMRRTAGGAHLLTNLSHGRELVQFFSSLLKSDKLWKFLSGCLDNHNHCILSTIYTRFWTPYKTRRVRPHWYQTLHQPASPLFPIGKIHPFSKITVTLEPVMQFWCSLRFRIS